MKKFICLMMFIVIIFVISVVLFDSLDDHKVYESGSKDIISESSSTLSIMLEDGYESGMYEVTKDTSWPSSGYTFNEKLSSCINGGSLRWDSDTNIVYFSGTSKDYCYIYFDAKELSYTISEILATKTISTRTDFSVAFTEDTTGIVYETTDNDGTTYYWAGDATDNYVYFAGFYWRIVRVNGDGTLRLIYDGTEAHVNGESSSDRYVSGFSSVIDSYVDMSYFVSYTGTYSIYYSSGESSGLKYRLDGWYSKCLEDTEYEDYIYQNGKFCNDVEVYSDDSATSMGMYKYAITYYPNYRITNYSPSLECSNEDDIYNVGTLSVDEVMYAGGTYRVGNTSYYLYIGYDYWTMSPSEVTNTLAYVHIYGVGSNGSIYSIGGSNDSYAYAKPVINLNSDILLQGDGTIDNIYTVVMN